MPVWLCHTRLTTERRSLRDSVFPGGSLGTSRCPVAPRSKAPPWNAMPAWLCHTRLTVARRSLRDSVSPGGSLGTSRCPVAPSFQGPALERNAGVALPHAVDDREAEPPRQCVPRRQSRGTSSRSTGKHSKPYRRENRSLITICSISSRVGYSFFANRSRMASIVARSLHSIRRPSA
ncbi:hypothetical protein Enr13x_55920 [Stieleria neptunia]|uniref:Uncharacterized protein n=1 Tax=Stieleria neptunia TaxID=2527979 RepID=A0A518HXX3_9BACT|nr:hypothetical protein Enr13x_55920 [Stieleria neptunia]